MKTRVLRMLRRFPNVPRLRVWPGRLSHLPPWIVLAVLATAGVAAVVLVPPLIAPEVADPQAQLEVLDRARLTVALIFGGFVALLGVYMNWRRVNALERQVATAQLGQITERFTRAIDQLGAVRPDNTPVPEIRAGGVRSLERIAGESPEDLWPILDILSAYLRSESPAPPVEIDGDDLEQFEERAYAIRNRMDVAFTIDAIGRLWPRNLEEVRMPLDLAFVFAPRITLVAKNLRNADLQQAQIRDANFGRADLQGADLQGAGLANAIFEDAHLQGAILTRAGLPSARLKGAALEGASLASANLEGADLQEADLRNANVRLANLAAANLRGADLRNAIVRLANLAAANLQEADLRGADLRGADLRDANLQGANLQEADLRGTDLRSADLRDVNLQGANLQEADLRGTDLRSADLRDVNLQGANLQEADLRGTDLRGADLRDVNWFGTSHDVSTQWPEGFVPPPA